MTPVSRPERRDKILRRLHAVVYFDTCTRAISFEKAGIAHTPEAESFIGKRLKSIERILKTHDTCTSADLQYRLVGGRTISERSMESSL